MEKDTVINSWMRIKYELSRWYLLPVLIMMFSISSYGQIGKVQEFKKITEIGRVERYMGYNYYSLYTLSFVEVENGIRSYALVFTDEKTLYNEGGAETRALSFTATQEEIDYLYGFLKEGFREDQIRSLEVGKGIIQTLPISSRFLRIYVHFGDDTSASLRLKKRQLAKLFGKK